MLLVSGVVNNDEQTMPNSLVTLSANEVVRESNVPELLTRIRPQWQSRNLITRVRRLLEVDPSSACQRLLNAAIHDLRDKVAIAGTDIATEAAKQYKLPPITGPEDIDNYPTSKLIDLAYRMGLLSRPDWRRVCRCYEIRRDLEHEDDEYEAGVEDCVYVFMTCIDVILSRDPTVLVKVTDFKELIEQAGSIVPDESLLEDYQTAPQPRQEEILKFLISYALDKELSDILQQNAYTCITYLRQLTRTAALVKIGEHLQQKAGRRIDMRTARVAIATGVFAYLRQTARVSFFDKFFENMENVGTKWTANPHHGELLRSLSELGGLEHCPQQVRKKFLKWLVQTYIGVPGGQTRYGNVRHVFYSNSAAPLIREILTESAHYIRDDLIAIQDDRDIKRALRNGHIVRRLEDLIDLVDIA